MKLFECQHCGQALFFENTACGSCKRRLGYLPEQRELSALEPDAALWRALASPERLRKFCRNAEPGGCNWLLPADSEDTYCLACRHNRTIPDLSDARNLRRWREVEGAKHRLFYSLLAFDLPMPSRRTDPEGLAFDFLPDPHEGSSQPPAVMTGHDSGLITLSLSEADDVERERRRTDMGELYRTLLGHFRHEVGHYFWDRLVRGQPSLQRFRALFGDERTDYGEALKAHYANGPRPDWQQFFVSAYASTHPWEDFAETWAHYLHIVDTLETAHAYGLQVQPQVGRAERLSTRIDFDPYAVGSCQRLIDAWLPLTFALNSLNRSMGLRDLYPFVLSPKAIEKLGFVHERIYAHRRAAAAARGPVESPLKGSGDRHPEALGHKAEPRRAAPEQVG